MPYMILFRCRRNTNQLIQQAEMQTFELRNQGIKEEAWHLHSTKKGHEHTC